MVFVIVAQLFETVLAMLITAAMMLIAKYLQKGQYVRIGDY